MTGIKKSLASITLLLVALPTHVVLAASSVQELIFDITKFIGKVLLPFLFSLALLFFLVNIARYFILKSAETSEREKARVYALYSIGAFVIILSIWGIVNLFTSAFDIDNAPPLCPDYNPDCTNTY